jgi:beta-carotene ketolase (CrtO type)
VEGNRAAGVVLANGETIRAVQVVGAVDPMTLLTKLVDPDRLPRDVQDELRGMQVVRCNISAFKGDAALSQRPAFPRYPDRSDAELSSILLAPDADYVSRAARAAVQGEIVDEKPMLICNTSFWDRSLVPPGSDGDTMYFYPTTVPYQLSGGRQWRNEKEKYFEHCLDIMDDYAPGLKSSVIGTNTLSPQDIEDFAYRGNLWHVDMTMAQLGPWRPTPSLSGYRTPFEGLWHTASGAHPAAFVTGWSGRTTARTILKQSRSRRAQ